MRFRLTVAALGLAALSLLAGCQPANDPKNDESSYADLKTASPAVQARYAAASAAMGGAMGSLGTVDSSGYDLDTSNSDYVVVTYHATTTTGVQITGTSRTSTIDQSSVMNLTMSLSNVDDGNGNKVSGSMTMKGTRAADGTGTTDITADFTVAFADATSSHLVMSGHLVTTGSGTTNTGSVSVDGVSYSFGN